MALPSLAVHNELSAGDSIETRVSAEESYPSNLTLLPSGSVMTYERPGEAPVTRSAYFGLTSSSVEASRHSPGPLSSPSSRVARLMISQPRFRSRLVFGASPRPVLPPRSTYRRESLSAARNVYRPRHPGYPGLFEPHCPSAFLCLQSVYTLCAQPSGVGERNFIAATNRSRGSTTLLRLAMAASHTVGSPVPVTVR